MERLIPEAKLDASGHPRDGQDINSGSVRRRFLLTGLVAAGAFVGIYAAAAFPFIAPALRKICLPYVPATSAQVQNVFEALQGRTGSLIDLGSGDGRLVLEAAKRGFNAEGVELNRWLVWYSHIRARRLGLRQNAKFARKDLWKVDFSLYKTVIIFGVDEMMEGVERKAIREFRDGGCLVACRFPLSSARRPTRTIGSGLDTVWLYDFCRVQTTSAT